MRIELPQAKHLVLFIRQLRFDSWFFYVHQGIHDKNYNNSMTKSAKINDYV